MNSLIRLTDRKKRILEFIIREYIDTAEPVGSRTISKNKDLGVSAATIRNEMSDLEELGLLLQPHTSAGRVPSQEAYELYVRNFLNTNFTQDNDFGFETVFDNISKINTLIDESLKILTKETNYTAIALSKKSFSNNRIAKFDLVYINDTKIVFVVIFQNGIVKNTLIDVPIKVDYISVKSVENILNQYLVGFGLEDINEEFLSKIKFKTNLELIIFNEVLNQLYQMLNRDENVDIALNGTTNMFTQPEFNDIEKAKALIDLLADKDTVKELFDIEGIRKNDVNITLGTDEMGMVIKDVAIISADINYEGSVIGKIGIIAPKRMDYKKAYSVVNYIQMQINNLISKL